MGNGGEELPSRAGASGKGESHRQVLAGGSPELPACLITLQRVFPPRIRAGNCCRSLETKQGEEQGFIHLAAETCVSHPARFMPHPAEFKSTYLELDD